eukprot:TRINITY_DN32779_c0_g1_i1.p1 TRINITY_DN32779_c0_g1~~TRINITY_DN32779_c0_g1_i1.p1  ORF type:complete len:238 (+),score=39.78 TRINITY_DN32779_c0_g1_i1:62-775(+)
MAIRRQRCSPAIAFAISVLMIWASFKDLEIRDWSAGMVQRRGALQILAASSVAGIGDLDARAVVAAGPALSPRQCIAPYEGGGCALSAQVPMAWQKGNRSNPMRLAQWEIDSSEKTDVVIFFLPVGQGIEEQLRRWEAEFPSKSRSSGPTRSGDFNADKGTAVLIEVAGSWDGGGPSGANKDAQLKSGYAMCGAIVPGGVRGERQMAFFVKVVGPQTVVRANTESFKQFVSSMQYAS